MHKMYVGLFLFWIIDRFAMKAGAYLKGLSNRSFATAYCKIVSFNQFLNSKKMKVFELTSSEFKLVNANF